MAMKRAASDSDDASTTSSKHQAAPLFLNRSVEAWQQHGLGCLSALPSSALESTWCFLSTEETMRLRYRLLCQARSCAACQYIIDSSLLGCNVVHLW
jgi:hypothetical protein